MLQFNKLNILCFYVLCAFIISVYVLYNPMMMEMDIAVIALFSLVGSFIVFLDYKFVNIPRSYELARKGNFILKSNTYLYKISDIYEKMLSITFFIISPFLSIAFLHAYVNDSPEVYMVMIRGTIISIAIFFGLMFILLYNIINFLYYLRTNEEL